jgi:DNA-binding CsgD family transcriptional regulator
MIQSVDSCRAAGMDSLVLSWMESDQTCRVVVDDALDIVWANAAATAELSRNRGLDIHDGRLSAADPTQQVALVELFGRAASGPADCCLSCMEDDAHVILRIRPIGPPGAARLFGVTFRVSGPDYNARYLGLERAFGLTKAEYRILLRLLDGRTAEDAANDLGVGIETARSHIRQIYSKLRVRSREGLFRRILPFHL